MTGGFRRLYGSDPLHLIGHLVVFSISAFAIVQILGEAGWVNWIAWFLGAALLHDLVLLPVYSVLDRVLGRMAPAAPLSRRALGNHLRAPAVISGILLIVYFPVILGLSGDNYLHDTGHHLAGYTRNWLLITAALFVASALVYAVRARPPRPPAPVKARERRDP